MFAEVTLRIFYRDWKPGSRVRLALNTAIRLVDAGDAVW